MEMIKKEINGQLVDVIPMTIVSGNEPWSEYFLESGDILRIKRVMKKVYQIANQKGSDGNSMYIYYQGEVSDVLSVTDGFIERK